MGPGWVATRCRESAVSVKESAIFFFFNKEEINLLILKDERYLVD